MLWRKAWTRIEVASENVRGFDCGSREIDRTSTLANDHLGQVLTRSFGKMKEAGILSDMVGDRRSSKRSAQ